jgi:hypothetical protein
MIISAKFASFCPCCKTRIALGERIEWSRGSTARHVACSATGAPATTSAPRTARRTRGARYCEGWGADNPHAPRPAYTCHDCEGE